jgi:hypothetical protein
MCEYNSTFGHGLDMVVEAAELPLGSWKHWWSTGNHHPESLRVPFFLASPSLLFTSSTWVANRIVRTKFFNMLLGVEVYCDSD